MALGTSVGRALAGSGPFQHLAVAVGVPKAICGRLPMKRLMPIALPGPSSMKKTLGSRIRTGVPSFSSCLVTMLDPTTCSVRTRVPTPRRWETTSGAARSSRAASAPTRRPCGSEHSFQGPSPCSANHILLYLSRLLKDAPFVLSKAGQPGEGSGRPSQAAPRLHAARAPGGRRGRPSASSQRISGAIGALVDARDAVQVVDRHPSGLAGPEHRPGAGLHRRVDRSKLRAAAGNRTPGRSTGRAPRSLSRRCSPWRTSPRRSR